jgi:glycosyltransferase involved in cell wall biosynthesis|tara:strand:- start:1496 stop:2197 length:702 start_codon:yes stop_codon:yes gene_type:complete
MEKNPTLISIIVPVYNEEKTIFEILNKISNLRKNEYSLQVIVIDDGSNDSSIKILKDNQHLIDKLILNEKNKGKGYSVKKGLEIADGKYIIFQDADLEYDPNDLLKFFKLIEKFQPDLIIGSRFIYSEYTRSHNILNKFGNNFITLLFNLIYNTTFTDIYSCYACFKKNLFNFADLKTEGFEQHAEILCKAAKKGKKFYEVPISYNGRTHDEGKKIKFYHIFGVIYQILIGRF